MGGRARRGGRYRLLASGAACVLAGVIAAAGAGPGFAGPDELDPAYGPLHGGTEFNLGVLNAAALEPDGGFVVVGYGDTAAGRSAVVARLRPDGRRDRRFGTVTLPSTIPGNDRAHAAVVEPNGKIVVVGTVTDDGGLHNFAVWRLQPSGAMDSSFGGGDGFVEIGTGVTDDTAFDVALAARGRIVVAGASIGTSEDIAVVRLTGSGTLDPSFNNGQPSLVLSHPGEDLARAVAVQPDGKIVLAGRYDGTTGNAVLRIIPGTMTSNAVLDASFGGAHVGIVGVDGSVMTFDTDLAITAGGKILFLDQVASPVTPGEVDATVVRLTDTGAVDTSYGPSGSTTGTALRVPGGSSTAEALTVLPSGGAAVVGQATPDLTTDGLVFVAKLRGNGLPDRRMGPGGIADSYAFGALVDVAASSDGRILIAGNSNGANYVLRLLGDLQPPTCVGKKATMVGTNAGDTMVGTPRADVIAGRGGRDTITGLGKGDIVCGGAGNDHIRGGAGPDTLLGGSGRDTLRGGPGRDDLRGGAGQDTLRQ